MPAPAAIPDALLSTPFTTATAREHGIDRGVLSGRRFRQLYRGVWIAADAELTFDVRLRAALLALPGDAVVSHTSAMRVYGLEPARARWRRLEFSTNTASVTRHDGIVLHRRLGRLHPRSMRGVAVTGPDRTFVDCATRLSFIELVQLGDFLVHAAHTTLGDLFEYAVTRHLDGVRKARRAIPFVREGVESPMETVVRLMLVFSRLPEPECNRDILDGDRHVARGDLVYREWKVLVEYDGWHHERDAWQRQRDIVRREQLEAAGWIIIVVTSGDLTRPQEIPWRVHRALTSRGYTGSPPRMSVVWNRWFR